MISWQKRSWCEVVYLANFRISNAINVALGNRIFNWKRIMVSTFLATNIAGIHSGLRGKAQGKITNQGNVAFSL